MKEKVKWFCFVMVFPLVLLSGVFIDSAITNGYGVMLILSIVSVLLASVDFALVLVLGN